MNSTLSIEPANGGSISRSIYIVSTAGEDRNREIYNLSENDFHVDGSELITAVLCFKKKG